MSKGWISLSRKIQDCWIWQDKPFSKGQAWVDMLLNANHDDKKFLLGSELVEVKRGSFITSEHKLMDRWGWSKTKVRAFLSLLENDSMIEKITDRKKTTINIVNYSDYQDSQTTKEPQKDHKKTTKEPQKDPNNNDNNDNNINKRKEEPRSPLYQNRYSDGSFEIKCVRYLIDSIRSEMPNAKLPSTNKEIDKWCDNIEKMVRIDKRTNEDIYNTLVYARTGNFWKANIRSTSKFREKYETLYLQMKNKKEPVKQTAKTNKFNNFPQREYKKEEYLTMEQKLLNRGR